MASEKNLKNYNTIKSEEIKDKIIRAIELHNKIAPLEKDLKDLKKDILEYLNRYNLDGIDCNASGKITKYIRKSENADIPTLKAKYSKIWEKVKKTSICDVLLLPRK